MRRSAFVLIVLVTALAVFGAGYPTRSNGKVATGRWARSVCTTMSTWVRGAEAGSTQVQEILKAPGATTITARDALAQFLNNATTSTEQVIRKLRRAGYPDTPKGRQAARGLRDAFGQVHTAFREGAALAAAMPTDDPARFQTAATDAQTKIAAGFDEFQRAFDRLDRFDPDHRIGRAFMSVAACRKLRSR